ncbi:MAG: hypothetical protein Q4B60_02530 [Erysipelotrichaceae bacterium]|nr:hypothetical protein [Erysipelotrichaceae bacterium]
MKSKAYFHLPGLFEYFELYKAFLPLYKQYPEYFYEDFAISSIYGAPTDCIWSGGRVSTRDYDPKEVSNLLKEYNISARLTFSNSLLTDEHLNDYKCNHLAKLFNESDNNGVIIYSDLLLNYLKEKYPKLYYVSTTTKVLTDKNDLIYELNREEFKYVVPDFRLNKDFDLFESLNNNQKEKIELLCNECCYIGCRQRKECYESVSKLNLGIDSNHLCNAPDSKDGYRFSKAMKSPSFIGIGDIREKYLPLGINNFKIEGRGLGSALILEFLLYYLVKPEYHINIREEIYLDNSLDLF